MTQKYKKCCVLATLSSENCCTYATLLQKMLFVRNTFCLACDEFVCHIIYKETILIVI